MKIFILFILIGTSNLLFAQVSVNGDLLIPTKGSGSLLGVSSTYHHDFNQGLSIGGTAGIRFSTQSQITAFQIPFMGHIRYYVDGSDAGFYPEFQLGFVHARSSSKLINFTVTSTNFAFGVGAGYNIESGIDIGLRFESISYKLASANYIALRVGYRF
jgi:hypothetical protein